MTTPSDWLEGFTPVPDELARRYTPTVALVFARVWRYTMGSDGVCRASLETLCNETGLTRNTVKAALVKLCSHDAPYLIDLTPDEKYKPHHYKDGGLIALKITVESVPPQKLTPSKIDPVPPQFLTKTPSKIEDKERIKKESKRGAGNTTARQQLYPVALAMAQVSGKQLEANPRIFQDAKLLSHCHPLPTPELVKEKYSMLPGSFWKTCGDWRARKGDRPSPVAIRETWGQWEMTPETSPLLHQNTMTPEEAVRKLSPRL